MIMNIDRIRFQTKNNKWLLWYQLGISKKWKTWFQLFFKKWKRQMIMMD